MSFGFDTVAEQKKGYLRQAGLQQNAKFVGLSYVANELWEGLDIELQTADGKVFTERTFGPNIDKVFPKAKWENGKQVGMETREEAYKRVEDEISQKLFYLGLCFTDSATLKAKVVGCRDLKELVSKVNAVIGDATDIPLNFLTIWKNSDGKQRSNLIIADKVRWVEPTQFGADGAIAQAGIKLTTYQLNNNMVEKYPYNGNTAPAAAPASVTSNLPF